MTKGTFAAVAASLLGFLVLLLWQPQSAVSALPPSVPPICRSHTFYDASDNGEIKVVSGVANQKIYVCGYILGVGGTATNLNLAEGTGSNCGSSNVQLTPAWQLAANSTTGYMSGNWSGFVTASAGDDLCVNASAGNAHQAEIWYIVQP